MSKRVLTVVLFLIAAALAGASWYFLKDADTGRPEISFSNEKITYREGDDVSVLLVNVSAYDERDGDLTSEIRVNQITPIENQTKARVTYVVIDNQKNIATAKQIVDYIPLSDESADESPAGEMAETESLSEEEVAADDLSDEISVEEVKPEAPVLVLNSASATIDSQETFDYMSYIDSITDDKDSQESLYRNIIIEGDYITKREGTYPLTIYVNDRDGNSSNQESFVLNRG